MDYAIMNPPASIRCQADALHFAILTTMKYTCGEGSKVDYDEAKKLYDFFCDNVEFPEDPTKKMVDNMLPMLQSVIPNMPM